MKIENYQDAIKKSISVARDLPYKDNKSKEYGSINSIQDLVKLTSIDTHLYEILTNKVRKIYIDIDKISLSRSDTDALITKLIICLNETLETTLTIHELVILTNKEEDDIIRSIHVILPNLKMDFNQQKDLINYLNDKYDFCLDNKVYYNNKLFRMINQSKLSNGKVLLNYNNINTNVEQSFINPNRNGKQLYFKKVFDLEETQTTKSKILINSLYLYEYVISNINTSFYNSNDWTYITLGMIKLNIIKDYNAWSSHSISQATTHYEFDKNMKFIQECVDNKNNYFTLNILYKKLNKYFDDFIYHNEYSIPTSSKDYLISMFPYNYESIIDFLTLKVKGEPKIREFLNKNDELIYINKCGFVKTPTETINLFYDFNSNYEKENVILLNNIDECRIKLEDWLSSNDKLYILKSAYGTGKTYNILNRAVESFIDLKILFITESNTLNKATTKSLNNFIRDKTEDLFVSHTEDLVLSSYNKIVCSVQSIKKIGNKKFDLVICDEFESIINCFLSKETFKKTIEPKQAYKFIIQILKDTPKIILTDADISNDRINIISKEIDVKPIVYKNRTTSFINTKVFIHTNIDCINTKIMNDINNNIKICYVVAIKSQGLSFKSSLLEKKIQKNILVICKEEVSLYIYNDNDYNTIPLKKEVVLQNIEQVLLEYKVDIFIYTPTIKTGISINTEYFDKTYGFSSTRSINYKEFLQMLFRARKIKEIHIHIQENLFKMNIINETFDQTNYKQFIKDELYNQFNTLTTQEAFEKVNIEDPFRLLQITSINEKNNTTYNLTYNIIGLLKYHKLTYTYDIEDIELQYNQVEQNEIFQEEIKNEWLNLPVMDIRNYLNCRLKEETNQDVEDKPSFYKTKNLFLLFKIEKKILDLLYFYRINHEECFKYQLSSYDILKYLNEATETTFQYHQQQIDDYVERFVQCEIYDNYFRNNDYRKVFSCRRFFEDVSKGEKRNFLKSNNFTQSDLTDINKAFTTEFLYYFNIKKDKPNIFTNLEVKNILQKNLNVEILTLLINKSSNKIDKIDLNNKLHFNHILKFMRGCFDMILCDIRYLNKNNHSRDSDKLSIQIIESKIKVKKQKNRKTLDQRHKHLSNEHNIINPIDVSTQSYNKLICELNKPNHRLSKKDFEKIRDYQLLKGGYTKTPNVYFNHYLEKQNINIDNLILKSNEFFKINKTPKGREILIPVSVREITKFTPIKIQDTIIKLYNINEITITISNKGYVEDFRNFLEYSIKTYEIELIEKYNKLNDYEILCVISGETRELTNPNEVYDIRTFIYNIIDKLKVDTNALQWLAYSHTIKKELKKMNKINIADF